MALESGTYISDLNSNNPVGATDPKSQGDDHLRLIKTTILNTFQNVTGAITSTHTELNYLDGATGFTGTGNTVRSASPTFTGTITAAAITTSGVITGDGSGLTTLNATNLSSGTVPNGRISASSIQQHESSIDHDDLLNFVANEHINHASVDIIAGAGLTGGGDITQDRTLNVVGGSGITANANDVAVDSTVVRTTGTQSIGGVKTFTSNITMSGTRTIDATTRLNLTGATVSVGESGGDLGFYGSAGSNKASVGGARNDPSTFGALYALLQYLENLGLLTDNTTES